MSRSDEFVDELKKVADAAVSPAYAAVGAADAAAEKAREAVKEFDSDDLRSSFTTQAEKAKDLPSQLLELAKEFAEKAQAQYEEFANRGEQVIARLRDRSATEELREQFDHAMELGKDALASARKSVTNAVHEVEDAAKQLASSVEGDAQEVVEDVKTTAKKTTSRARSAAK
ncbi:MAG: hypothetical protein V9F82_06335 [Dermatophilaceae bacterium]